MEQKGKTVCICVFRSRLSDWATDNVKVCHCASCRLGRPTVCQSGNSPLKRGIQLKMSLNNKHACRKCVCFSFICSGGATMNRKLSEVKPLKYPIGILLQVWFHLMGYVVHVYWLERSKPHWSWALALVILHANKMRDQFILDYMVWFPGKCHFTFFTQGHVSLIQQHSAINLQPFLSKILNCSPTSTW